MKRNGIFIDPALGEDRFDFSGEPLPEEEVKKEEEKRLARLP